MSLEEEMKKEIKRIQDEISQLDSELRKLQDKIVTIISRRRKLERDLNILLSHFEPSTRKKEFQTSLAGIVK